MGSAEARGPGDRLLVGGRLLAYSGDSIASPPLDRLVEGAEIAIVEATSPGAPYSHLSWEEAHALRDRHPGTRFLFVHIFEGRLDGAVSDLEVVDVCPGAAGSVRQLARA